jgi:hypothetical protein
LSSLFTLDLGDQQVCLSSAGAAWSICPHPSVPNVLPLICPATCIMPSFGGTTCRCGASLCTMDPAARCPWESSTDTTGPGVWLDAVFGGRSGIACRHIYAGGRGADGAVGAPEARAPAQGARMPHLTVRPGCLGNWFWGRRWQFVGGTSQISVGVTVAK